MADSSLKLTDLAINLQEVYSAAHGGELVSNVWGTRLYNTTSSWGRIWTWFFAIASLFVGSDFKKQKLKEAILKTEGAFKKQLPDVEGAVTKYKDYLSRRLKGKNVGEEQFHPARKKISTWNRLAAPFRKMDQKKIDRFLRVKRAPTFPVVQRIIDFEGILQEPLPFSSLKKLALDGNLQKKEQEEIDTFIKSTKGCGVHQLHRFLSAFISYLNEGNLVTLEMRLFLLRCHVFIEKDQKHLAWRNSLKPGEKVDEHLLGEQLGDKEEGFDQNLIFAIEGDPDKVMVVGQNRAILGLKQRGNEMEGCTLETPEVYAIDPKGRYAIVERLEEPFSNYQWVSTSNRIDEKDKDYADPIAGLVKWMIKEQISDEKLIARNLMFDRNGVLKTVKYLTPCPFDFSALERFLYDCSAGNPYIFRHLIKKTGMKEHSYYKFIRKMVQITLRKGVVPDISDEATNRQETIHPKIIDAANDLCYEILELKTHLYNETDLTEEQVSNKIKRRYLDQGASTMLLPNFKKSLGIKNLE